MKGKIVEKAEKHFAQVAIFNGPALTFYFDTMFHHHTSWIHPLPHFGAGEKSQRLSIHIQCKKVLCAHVVNVFHHCFYLWFHMNCASQCMCHSPGSRVVLSPYPYVLVQMMRPQDGGVSGQVLKIVHDDSHKKIQHLEETKKCLNCFIYTPQIKLWD